jgi:hypothetical protein
MLTDSQLLIEAISTNNVTQLSGLITPHRFTNIARVNLNTFMDERGYSALHIGAEKNAYDVINSILNLYPNIIEIPTRDQKQCTALHIAAIHGYVESINALIARRAIINSLDNLGSTPLMYAAYSGHANAVNILIQQLQSYINSNHAIQLRDANNKSAIEYAIERKHCLVVELLFIHFLDTINPSVCRLAVEQDNVQLFRKLLSCYIPSSDDLTNAKGMIKQLLDYKPAKREKNRRKWLSIGDYAVSQRRDKSVLERMLYDADNTSDEDSSDSDDDEFKFIRKPKGLLLQNILYRGVHFTPTFFNTAEKKLTRQLTYHQKPVYSRATEDLSKKIDRDKVFGYEQADQIVKNFFTLLRVTPDKHELDKDYKKKKRKLKGEEAKFETLYYRFIQVYVNSYQELFNAGGMSRNFNFCSDSNPVISTTLDAEVACCYASGERINHSLIFSPKVRRSTGKLKHRRLGYIHVYYIDNDSYQKHIIDIDEINRSRKIGLIHNYRFNKEIVIESSIPTEFVLGYQTFSLPNFNTEWLGKIKEVYGLDEGTYKLNMQRLLSLSENPVEIIKELINLRLKVIKENISPQRLIASLNLLTLSLSELKLPDSFDSCQFSNLTLNNIREIIEKFKIRVNYYSYNSRFKSAKSLAELIKKDENFLFSIIKMLKSDDGYNVFLVSENDLDKSSNNYKGIECIVLVYKKDNIPIKIIVNRSNGESREILISNQHSLWGRDRTYLTLENLISNHHTPLLKLDELVVSSIQMGTKINDSTITSCIVDLLMDSCREDKSIREDADLRILATKIIKSYNYKLSLISKKELEKKTESELKNSDNLLLVYLENNSPSQFIFRNDDREVIRVSINLYYSASKYLNLINFVKNNKGKNNNKVFLFLNDSIMKDIRNFIITGFIRSDYDYFFEKFLEAQELVREGLIVTLGESGIYSREIIEILNKELRNENDWIRTHAAEALVKLGAMNKFIFSILLEAKNSGKTRLFKSVGNPDKNDYDEIAEAPESALNFFGNFNKKIIKECRQLLKNDNRFLRELSVNRLINVNFIDQDVFKEMFFVFVEYLKNKENKVVESVFYKLLEIEKNTHSLLKIGLEDQDNIVKEISAVHLNYFTKVREFLVDFLESNNWQSDRGSWKTREKLLAMLCNIEGEEVMMQFFKERLGKASFLLRKLNVVNILFLLKYIDKKQIEILLENLDGSYRFYVEEILEKMSINILSEPIVEDLKNQLIIRGNNSVIKFNIERLLSRIENHYKYQLEEPKSNSDQDQIESGTYNTHEQFFSSSLFFEQSSNSGHDACLESGKIHADYGQEHDFNFVSNSSEPFSIFESNFAKLTVETTQDGSGTSINVSTATMPVTTVLSTDPGFINPNNRTKVTDVESFENDGIPEELSKILMQLQSESISREPDGYFDGLISSNVSSLPIILPAPTAPVGGSTLEEVWNAFEVGKAKFEKLLKDKRLVATQVSGRGLDCFIYSLLQHVTGRYDLSFFDNDLVCVIKKTAGLDPDFMEMRYDDTEDSLEIVKAINKIFRINLKVYSIQINNEGQPIILPPLFESDALGPMHPVILWLQVDHYVAVTSLTLSIKMVEQSTPCGANAQAESETARRLGSSTPVQDETEISHSSFSFTSSQSGSRMTDKESSSASHPMSLNPQHEQVENFQFGLSQKSIDEIIVKNLKRSRLSRKDKIVDKVSGELPEEFCFGVALDLGDCFFDAVALALNEKNGNEEYDIIKLRNVCKKYVVAHRNDKDNEIMKLILNKEELVNKTGTYEDNAIKIPPVSREKVDSDRLGEYIQKMGIEVGSSRLPIWGDYEIEGRIFCKEFNIKLHVVKIEEEENTRKKMEQEWGAMAENVIIDKNGLDEDHIVSDYKSPFDDKNIIHLAVYRKHFVPILKNESLKKYAILPDFSETLPGAFAFQERNKLEYKNNDETFEDIFDSEQPLDISNSDGEKLRDPLVFDEAENALNLSAQPQIQANPEEFRIPFQVLDTTKPGDVCLPDSENTTKSEEILEPVTLGQEGEISSQRVSDLMEMLDKKSEVQSPTTISPFAIIFSKKQPEVSEKNGVQKQAKKEFNFGD